MATSALSPAQMNALGRSVITSGDLDQAAEIFALLVDAEIAEASAVLALGYAGWAPGQLENEIRQNVWLTCDADEDLLFDDDHAHKWSRSLAKLGISAEHLSGQAGRA